MAWTIEYSHTAKRGLRRLDKTVARRIAKRMDERAASDDPPRGCLPLTGRRRRVCRYRVGNFRAICEIRYKERNILVAEVGPRDDIY